MYIDSLSVSYSNSKWKVSDVEFNNITLLVGASGVGKTKILDTLILLQGITRGFPIPYITWKVAFSILDKERVTHHYLWEGEYAPSIPSNTPVSTIQYERITKNQEKIITRDGEEFWFNNKEMPKLDRDKSAVSLLKREELIRPIYEGFQKIIFSKQYDVKRIGEHFMNKSRQDALLQQYKTLADIRASGENIITKLFLAYNHEKGIINKILDIFKEIFPFVEDLKIESLRANSSLGVNEALFETPFIQLKEKSIDEWILQGDFSSGMFKSLLLISEMYLCAEGSIILIDEFENSLGINCIDELTFYIQTSIDRKIQLIITSHHPYIINQIDFNNWKLVTRKGGEVRVKNATESIDFTKSRQKAFSQLAQLDEFSTGISEE